MDSDLNSIIKVNTFTATAIAFNTNRKYLYTNISAHTVLISQSIFFNLPVWLFDTRALRYILEYINDFVAL